MLVYLQMIPEEKGKRKFRRLHDKYKGLMFYVANRILNNEMDAEDAVHEAFIAISKNISKISDVNANKTRSYVVTIVSNEAKNIYRTKKRHETVGFEEAFMGEKVFGHEMSALAMAMARLPAKYREVLLLKYDNGYKSKEIAKMLGMSDGMVRQTLMKARELLKEELEKEGVEV